MNYFRKDRKDHRPLRIKKILGVIKFHLICLDDTLIDYQKDFVNNKIGIDEFEFYQKSITQKMNVYKNRINKIKLNL